MNVSMVQVFKAVDYANSHPDKYLNGTTNWCAAVAFDLNRQASMAPQPPALGSEPDMNSDDNAIHIFTKLMAHKMARSAEKGRSGWQQCSQDSLSQMLREHVEKGDPIDVANFCMMLSANGFAISKAPIEFDVKPYGWVVGSQFYTSRSAAIEEAEKTPCIDVYTRAHLTPLQAEIAALNDSAEDTTQIIMRQKNKIDQLQARCDELEESLEQIAMWPDGGNTYGQEKIKGFASRILYGNGHMSTSSDKYKAELYDEVWQKARGMGFSNVTDALERLNDIDGI